MTPFNEGAAPPKKQSYLELCSDELLSKASNHPASEAATSELDPFEYLEDCFCRLLAPSYWHLVSEWGVQVSGNLAVSIH